MLVDDFASTRTCEGYHLLLEMRLPKKGGGLVFPFGGKRCVICLGSCGDVVGAHHFIVFMVDNVAVPDVSWAYGGIEAVLVDAWGWCAGSC